MLAEKVLWKFKFWREREKYALLHDVLALYTLILVVWGFYRLLFRFPVWVEELFLKPLVFIVPVVYRLLQMKGKSWEERLESVGIVKENWFLGLAFGLALGVFYLFVGRVGLVLRGGGIVGPPAGGLGAVPQQPIAVLGLALATALSEELVFIGYILLRLNEFWKHEWRSVLLTALMFGFIHLPILVFGYRLPMGTVLTQFVLVFLLGVGNGVVMLRVRNLLAPVISHTLWGMAVLLFG